MNYNKEIEITVSELSATLGVALIVALSLLAALYLGAFTPANFGG